MEYTAVMAVPDSSKEASTEREPTLAKPKESTAESAPSTRPIEINADTADFRNVFHPVQHERGPRKPKLPKDIQASESAKQKGPHQQVTALTSRPALIYPTPSLPPHLIASSELISSPWHPTDMSLLHGMSANAQPSLLHMLMGAERYQELIWPAHSPGFNFENIHSTGSTNHWLDSGHETTARILFMVIQWARSLTPLQTLANRDQIALLEESWKDLFLLTLAQWSATGLVDISLILANSKVLPDSKSKDSEKDEMIRVIKLMYDVLGRFRQLSPDCAETGCIKAIILFRPETFGLCDTHPISMLQDQVQCILSDYVRQKYPRQATRFGRLLLTLSVLRSIGASIVEKLFFQEATGKVSLHSLLNNMYSLERDS
ncbi:Nuclear receptor subfamily 2 group E member 1 [Nymphon striatum]|nr:Nuclear receptor subfamily 2 group E member 1 [Nymphon striatum]